MSKFFISLLIFVIYVNRKNKTRRKYRESSQDSQIKSGKNKTKSNFI